jgi:hypothetical protein
VCPFSPAIVFVFCGGTKGLIGFGCPCVDVDVVVGGLVVVVDDLGGVMVVITVGGLVVVVVGLVADVVVGGLVVVGVDLEP